MNVPDELIETDWAEAGCSKRSCRYEHSYIWGLCAHAEEPPPDTRCFRWKTVTAADGYLSIVTEEVDHTELRAEIERQVRAKVAEEIRAVWPDTLGMWDVNQAIAARTTIEQILKRVTRGDSDA